MTDSTYNGFANYETWNVELWIDNEEHLYRDKVRFIRRYCSDGYLCPSRIAEYVKECVFPNGTPDMKSAADMDRVDWDEIATHWSDEASELD